MLRKIGKYAGYLLLWALVVVVWVWADSSSKHHRQSRLTAEMNILIEGGHQHKIVDDRLMYEWLAEHGVVAVGVAVDKVPLDELESVAFMHSAVAEANAHVTHDGCVVLRIVQREPVARLRVEGYDMYITSDGYLFPASDGYAQLVPVITGGYNPLFEPDYSGYMRDAVRDTLASLEAVVAQLEAEKIPHLKERQQALKDMRKVTMQRVRKTPFMSNYEFDKRKEDLKAAQAEARRINLEANKRIDAHIASLELRQDGIRQKQLMLREVGNDFESMLSFVESINHDKFWSAEVVQIVLSGGGDEPMQVAIVPRSGSFVVDMGYAQRLEGRLDVLRRFYNKALTNLGWDSYRSISLRYDGQVVCR